MNILRTSTLTMALTVTLPWAAGAQVTQAGAPRDSLRGILALVADKRSADEIVQFVQVDCYTFAFASLDASLKRTPGYEGLTDALMRKCSALRIETDPEGASLRVAGHELGTVRKNGDLWLVDPGSGVEVVTTLGAATQKKTIDFPVGKMVQAQFSLAKDTLPLPSVRSPKQIATDLNLLSRWAVPTGGPLMPTQQAHMGAMSAGLIWGLIGGVGGALVGEFVPAAGCVKKYTVPAQGAYVRGVKYAGGTSVDLGGGSSCLGILAGGGGLGFFTIGALAKSSGNRSSNAAFDEAMRRYPGEHQAWVDAEQAKFLDQSPEVKFAITNDQQRLQLAQSENESIRRRNSTLPSPRFFMRDLPAGSRSSTSVAVASIGPSDVDQGIPHAMMANPNAVAVVIGNRDYQGDNVPKVDYAINDAKSIRRYLIDAFGFDSNRVVLDTNVTTGEMFNLFGNTDASSGRISDLLKTRDSVDVFVFYSGHGAPDLGQRYLVPVDADFDRLRNTGYAIDKLYRNLSQLKARSVTVAIDACFSGSSDGGAVQGGRSGSDDLEAEVGGVRGSATQVFTAVTSKETARWRRDQGHGLFTYFFLKGLQGEADADADGAVTAGELESYLKTNITRYAVEQLKGASQHPQVNVVDPKRVILRLHPK